MSGNIISAKDAFLAVQDILQKALADCPRQEGEIEHPLHKGAREALAIVTNQLNTMYRTLPPDLPSFEENLKVHGKYEDRNDKSENAIQFLERVWGKYLNDFNDGRGDFLYLDQLRKIDESLVNGLKHYFKDRESNISDTIPDKSSRVQKQKEQLLNALDGVCPELDNKKKFYLMQRAISEKYGISK